jgi:hypothetical protein
MRRTYGSVNSSSAPSFGVIASGGEDLEVRTVMAIVKPAPTIAGTIQVHPALELVITELDPARIYILQSSEDLEGWHDEEFIAGSSEEISRFRPVRHESRKFWRLLEIENPVVN